MYGGSVKILAMCKTDRYSIHIYLKAGCHVTEAHRQAMIPSVTIEVSHICYIKVDIKVIPPIVCQEILV